MNVLDGLRRALRAWPMALMLATLTALVTPAVGMRDRMAAADFGVGGFPFNISNGDYYQALPPAQTAVLALLFVVWVFLSGGIIDRLARDARSSSTRFFAACGACVGPLGRLSLLMLGTYTAVLLWIEPPMARAAETLEGPARMALFGALAIILFLIALVFDYARVRLVIEDRRSALGAIAASLRLLRAHPGRIFLTQGIFWLLLVVWITLRALAGTEPIWAGHLLGAGEILLKLGLLASQASIYQQLLASAGWVAREEPRWPDDAAANPAAL